MKSLILFAVLTTVCFSKYAEVSSILYNTRHRRSVEFENKLQSLRTLLSDPVDEEHDSLDHETSKTHAFEWVVQLSTNDDQVAREIGKKYGFDHIERIGLDDESKTTGVFRFSHDSLPNETNRKNEIPEATDDGISAIHDSTETIFKREEQAHSMKDNDYVRYFRRQRILEREKRVPILEERKDGKVTENKVAINFNDPEVKNEWYINNYGQTSGPKHFDSRVAEVWNMGYSGKGVKVSILDDGMDHTHPDLAPNYDPLSSKDINGHDDDPFPNDSDPYNAHGTKCAGTVAAVGNNSNCGVGIAYDSKIGAIRMLDGAATDLIEADALSFHRDHIDIYSCSWGPKDNGQTFGRPGNLGTIALAQGAKYGRGGKGSLFIWATGNGGRMFDDCNADGYVSNIYTLGIGSVNEHGVSTYYGEKCTAMMAVTYCSGSHSATELNNAHANVITTYLHHQCTNHFVGTSSAAPLAAAIFALLLEANPSLTWRDVQHLVFETAVKTSPLDEGWALNGCNKPYNHKFGFGVIDAQLLVKSALNWKNVAEQKSCHFRLNFKNGDIPSRHHFKLSFKTDGCQSCAKKSDKKGECKNSIYKLEHVVVNVTLKHRRRGDLSIDLISPVGTVSHLMHVRRFDSSNAGLKGWSFMTLFNWCENPSGTWQLVFKDNNINLYGEKSKPDKEDEYIHKLDEMKKKEMEKEKKNSEDESVEIVNAEENTRDYDNEKWHDYSERDNNRADADYYGSRYKRMAPVDDDVLYKKDLSKDFVLKYEDEVLEKGVLAGEVREISVTFYGT